MVDLQGNPLELDPPAPDDPDVIYFGPGVHEIGETYQNLEDGAVVYLAGGAYVKEMLECAINADPITIRGRGILSGIDYAHVPQSADDQLIELRGSQQQTSLTIEGITLVDAPKKNIITRGTTVIDNVKILSWHHQADGITAGSASKVRNSFIKVNDDAIKLYYSGMEITDNVIWHPRARRFSCRGSSPPTWTV